MFLYILLILSNPIQDLNIDYLKNLKKLKSFNRKGFITRDFLKVLSLVRKQLEENYDTIQEEKQKYYEDQKLSIYANNERALRYDKRFLPLKLLNLIELSNMSDEIFEGYTFFCKMKFVFRKVERDVFWLEEHLRYPDELLGARYEFGD